jgi:hypothetical protein
VANSINFGALDSSESIGSKFESSDDLHLMSPTKKVISRVVELQLERSWCHWKAKSKDLQSYISEELANYEGSALERTYSANECILSAIERTRPTWQR